MAAVVFFKESSLTQYLILSGLIHHPGCCGSQKWSTTLQLKYWLPSLSTWLEINVHVKGHFSTHSSLRRTVQKAFILFPASGWNYFTGFSLQVFSWLVLWLSGGKIVFQEALQVFKSGPLLRFLPPTRKHEFMQWFRALSRARHPVATLHLVQHLTVHHA